MARANDPLACLLYLLARNAVPFGQLEVALMKAQSDVTPVMPEDDPLVAWASQQADELRNP